MSFSHKTWDNQLYKFDGNIRAHQKKFELSLCKKFNIIKYKSNCNEFIINMNQDNFKRIMYFYNNIIYNKDHISELLQINNILDEIKFDKDSLENLGINSNKKFAKCVTTINEKLVLGPSVTRIIIESILKKIIYEYFKIGFNLSLKDVFIKYKIVIMWYFDEILIMGNKKNINLFKDYLIDCINEYGLNLTNKDIKHDTFIGYKFDYRL